MIEHLSDHVVACDASGRLLIVNAAARRPVPGADLDPLDSPRHFGLSRPDGVTPLPAAEVPLFRALHGEVIRDVDVAVSTPGTGLRRMLVSGRPVLDDQGRTLGAVVSGVDVTGVRDTEERLRESEERYRSVVESVGDTVFQADLRGRWVFLNESWARWTGVPVAEALGPSVADVHPDDRAAHTRAFVPLLAGEVDSVRLRHRYITADDVTCWAEVRASLTRDAAGRPLGIAGVIEDITEHHRTQQYEAAEQAVVDVLGAAIDIKDGVPVLLGALCRSLDWDLAELWTLDAEREVLHCADASGPAPRRGSRRWRRRATARRSRSATGCRVRRGRGARRSGLSGLEDDPLFRRGAAAKAAGVRSALRDADRARRGDARRDLVLLARAARSRSGSRPAAADDRRAPGAVPRAPPARSMRWPSAVAEVDELRRQVASA